MQSFSPWREELKRAWRELRGPRTTPGGAAISVALGLFIGSLPIFGCHTPLVIGLCLWFQLDGAIAWLASNVSNPIFAPVLLAAEVEIGSWLRTGTTFRFDHELMRASVLRDSIGYLCLGAPLAGLALALCGGAIAYTIVALRPSPKTRTPYELPEHAPRWVKAVERIATRYASPRSALPIERARFHTLRGKLVGDPVAKLVADIGGGEPNALGTLLDVGTGRGQLALLLIELGLASSARGIDWHEAKIACAQRAASAAGDGMAPLDAIFTRGDARETPFEPADTVLLIDVLHYLTLDEQDELLARAATAVRPGGRLLVREADTRRGWRSTMTLAEERLSTFVGIHRGERVCFRAVRDIAARLEAAGLTCTLVPAWGATPFSNVLVIGARPK
jgi:uncharacterized protein (DUF2062 family)/2-polyprenyl-3-methyl-5-hydroxy-6-metoxy-1,4-benzoquinol methylase